MACSGTGTSSDYSDEIPDDHEVLQSIESNAEPGLSSSRQRSQSNNASCSSDATSFVGKPKAWKNADLWSIKYKPCKRHNSLKAEFFCSTHYVSVCNICMMIDHIGCESEHIDIATRRFREEGGAAKVVSKIQLFERNYAESKRRLAFDEQFANSTRERAINDISSFHGTLSFRIDEIKTISVRKIDELHDDNEKHFGRADDELKSIGDSLNSLQMKGQDKFAGSLMMAIETMTLLKELTDKLDNLNLNSVRKYEFHQSKLVTEIIGDVTLLGEVKEKTDKQEVKPSKYEEIEASLVAERLKTVQLEDEVKKRDDHIATLTSQLNEVRTLIYADASKIGVFVTREGIRVLVFKTDIVQAKVECIVNASDKYLQHTTGVSKAIAKAAGKEYMDECKAYANNPLPPGTVCTTKAGNLSYYAIMHVVSPMWKDYEHQSSARRQKCEDDLCMTVFNVFSEAVRKGIQSVALPAIGSATAGIPLEICVSQYVRAVQQFSCKQRWGQRQFEIQFVDMNTHKVLAIQQAFLEAKENIQPLGFKRF